MGNTGIMPIGIMPNIGHMPNIGAGTIEYLRSMGITGSTGNSSMKLIEVFIKLRVEKNLHSKEKIRLEYIMSPTTRILERFQQVMRNLTDAMSELSAKEANSIKGDDMLPLYEHWYYVHIMGGILAERANQMCLDQEKENRKDKGQSLTYTKVIRSPQQEIAYLKEALEAETAKVQKLMNNDFYAELTRLRKEVTERQYEAKQLKERQCVSSQPPFNLKRNSELLEKSLSEKNTQLETLQALVEDLEKQRAGLHYECEQLKDRIRQERESSEMAIKEVRKELEAALKSKRLLELRCEAGERQSSLREQKAATELAAVITQLEEVRKQSSELEKELEQATRRLEASEAENSIDQIELTDLRRQVSRLENKLSAAFEEVQRSQRKFEQERSISEGLKRRLEESQNQSAGKAQADDKERRRLEDQNESLKRSLERTQEGYVSKEKQFEKELTRQDNSIRDLKYDIEKLRSDTDKKAAEAANTQRENSLLVYEVKDLCEINKRNAIKLEELTNQVKELSQRNTDLANDLENTNFESNMLEQRRLNEEIADLKEQLQESKALVRIKERQNDEQSEEYNRDIQENQQIIKRLRRKIEELEEQLAKYEE